MIKEHVKGKKKGDILLYALSTCIWCRKTKQLLSDLGIEYDYIFVDLVEDAYKDEVEEELKKWNPDGSFPTMVLDNKECIVGYKPEDIKARLK